MNNKKIITIVIVVFVLSIFLIALVSIIRSKKTSTSQNSTISSVTQKTETKEESGTEETNVEQPIMAVGQIVSAIDQGITIKTTSGDLDLKFRADTMITIQDSGKSPTPAAKDKSALVAGKAARVIYKKDTMEIMVIVIK